MIGIRSSGAINPGVDGVVYLTRTRYESAEQALRELALPVLPAYRIEIPDEGVVNISGPRVVEEANGQLGGGVEWTSPSPIDFSQAGVFELMP